MSVQANKDLDLRVFMTTDAVGGVWQYSLDLAEGLRPLGVEVTLAVLGPDPAPDQKARAEATGIELITTGFPLEWTAETRGEVEAAGRVLSRMAMQSRPHVVHLNTPALAAAAAWTRPLLVVCHSCVVTWWRAVRSGPLPDEFVWRKELIEDGCKAADVLLAPTDAFARETAEAYGLENQLLVVRNGRRRPSIRNGEWTIEGLFAFTAGRLWDEGKNFSAIDRAASHLEVPVLAAGPLQGPNGTWVEAHHAKALGRLSDAQMAQYLGAQPIFVSAARYEPFGLTALEAAQAGCALVLSDIPTFRELWDDAALFVSPDDDQAIANAIEDLTRDADRRAELGRAAGKRARLYSLEAMCTGMLAVYRSLVASKRDTVSPARAAI